MNSACDRITALLLQEPTATAVMALSFAEKNDRDPSYRVMIVSGLEWLAQR